MTEAPAGITGPSRLPKPAWTLVLASLGLFMSALDNMVVTTALPVLRVSLHASLSGLEWTVNAYLLSFACMLLTGAALGDRFGRKRMFCIGLAVFTAASAWAALSPTVGVLIAARVVQGAGAAIIMPLTLTLISEAFPAAKRAMAIGLWGGIAGLAVAGGPVVGGAVVEGLSWHWIFWLNVPVGLIVIPLSASRLRESFGPRARLDITGLLLAGAGFFGLVWAPVRASTAGWGSGEVIGTLAAGAALVGAFVWWERRTPAPMLSLALFRQTRFTSANGVSFLMYAGLFGTLFLMAQFLQSAQHYTPLQTGIRLLPWTAAAMVASPIAGKLAERYGNRPFMAGGLFLQAAGLAWMAAIATPRLGYGELGAALTVAGVGIGLVFPTVSGEIVASVPPGEIGVASGTNSALRELGGVFGVAVLATVFARPGVYTSPYLFADGFKAALWVGAGFSAAGVLMAVSAGRHTKPLPGQPRQGAPGISRPAPAITSETS
jgi:EmrB/QacA subfamily drug resistance transporter